MFLKVSLLIISIFLFITSFCAVHAQSADIKTVHVFVALCDNENQGIVPVPARLGNRTDLAIIFTGLFRGKPPINCSYL